MTKAVAALALVALIVIVGVLAASPAEERSADPQTLHAPAVAQAHEALDALPPSIAAIVEPLPEPDADDGGMSVVSFDLTDLEPVETSDEEIPYEYRNDNTLRMWVLPEFFEQRYEDATMEELLVARHEVEARAHALANEAVDRMFEAGLCDQIVIKRDGSEEDKVPPHSSSGLLRSRRTEVLPDGEHLLVRTLELPWKENVELYTAQDELFWLLKRLKN